MTEGRGQVSRPGQQSQSGRGQSWGRGRTGGEISWSQDGVCDLLCAGRGRGGIRVCPVSCDCLDECPSIGFRCFYHLPSHQELYVPMFQPLPLSQLPSVPGLCVALQGDPAAQRAS